MAYDQNMAILNDFANPLSVFVPMDIGDIVAAADLDLDHYLTYIRGPWGLYNIHADVHARILSLESRSDLDGETDLEGILFIFTDKRDAAWFKLKYGV